MSSLVVSTVGTTNKLAQSNDRSKIVTFGRLWNALTLCYEKNERDVDHAYGNHLAQFARLFGETLAELPVRSVQVTNQPLTSHETREFVLRDANEKHVFYAVLVLTNKRRHVDTSLDITEQSSSTFCGPSFDDRSASWLGESIFFQNFDETRFEQLQDYLNQTKTRPALMRQAVAAFRDLPDQQCRDEQQKQQQQEQQQQNDANDDSIEISARKSGTTTEHVLLRSEQQRIDDNRYGDRVVDKSNDVDPVDLMTVDDYDDFNDRHYDYDEDDEDVSYDASNDKRDAWLENEDARFNVGEDADDDRASYDSDDDRAAFGDLAFYDNYKKPVKPFQRPRNTSPSKWIAEIYKCFFNLFYQEVRSLPVSQRFSATSNDPEAFYGR